MGYIIAVEGTDGSGKKTQVDKLYERLVSEGINVKRVSFPNYDSVSSALVKQYLNGDFGDKDNCLNAYQASVLYAVDRLATYNLELKDFYDNGGVILFDRYVQSNMLHQAGKIENKDDVDKYLDWLEDLEFEKLQLPRPDRIFFLDMPIEYSKKLAESRGVYKSSTKKDIHESNPDHLIKAYNSGQYVCRKYNWNKIDCIREDSIKSIDEIHNEIYNVVKIDLENL